MRRQGHLIMANPSFNTFRKINYNNPQYQQAMLQRQNASDYSVNPNTRAITDKYTQAEASRIRGLDDFGIQNRLAQEALEFNRGLEERQQAMAERALNWRDHYKNKMLGIDERELAMKQSALRDAGKGADLGMLIGLAQGGMNLYDNAQERALQQQALAGQQQMQDFYLRQIADRTTAPAQGITFDPSLDQKRVVGRYKY